MATSPTNDKAENAKHFRFWLLKLHTSSSGIGIVFGVFLGALTASFLGGLFLRAWLPQSTTSYPLASFAQPPAWSLRINETKTLTPPPPTPHVPYESAKGWEVYFSNGSAALAPGQVEWIQRLSLLLKECQTLKLRLTGFASSAPFVNDSEQRNLSLANSRALTVQRLLAPQIQFDSFSHRAWQTYSDLDAERSFRDKRRAARIEDAAEFLNRRVTIELLSESKCPFLINRMAAPLPPMPAS